MKLKMLRPIALLIILLIVATGLTSCTPTKISNDPDKQNIAGYSSNTSIPIPTLTDISKENDTLNEVAPTNTMIVEKPPEIEIIKLDAKTQDKISISMPGGPELEIPEGGLYQDSTISLRKVPKAELGFTDSNVTFGSVFEFEISNDPYLSKIATLKIPYSSEEIPEGLSEADLVAGYYLDGRWIPVESEVDEENNVIIVQTFHNGKWSWIIIRNLASIEEKARAYLGEIRENPTNIEEATAEVERRRAEYIQAWNRMIESAQEFEANLNPIDEIIKEVQSTIVLKAADASAVAIGGKGALLTIGGKSIAVIGGKFLLAITAGLYLGTLEGDTVLEVRNLAIFLNKYNKLKEAEAILEGLKHPDKTIYYFDEDDLIVNWIEAQQKCSTEASTTIDWSCSAYREEEIQLAWDPSELIRSPIPTPTDTATPTLKPTKTNTPVPKTPMLYLDQNYFCRHGPGKMYEDIVDYPAGTVLPIIGKSGNDWWLVEIHDSRTRHTSCWIGGGDVRGDISSVPVVATPTLQNDKLPIYDFNSWQIIGYIACSEVDNFKWTVEHFKIESGGFYVSTTILFGSNLAGWTRHDGNKICGFNLP